MEGRWTITSAYDDHEVMDDPVRVLPSVRGPEQREPVPVVPCDDAAIERVASEMASWSGPVPSGVDGFRSFAELALRAAAEVPR